MLNIFVSQRPLRMISHLDRTFHMRDFFMDRRPSGSSQQNGGGAAREKEPKNDCRSDQVEEFELTGDFRRAVGGDFVERNQRRTSDQFGHIVRNVHDFHLMK